MNVWDAGSHNSGVRMAVASEKGTACTCPPVMKTLPFGRTTLLWKARALAIEVSMVTEGVAGGVPIVMRYALL